MSSLTAPTGLLIGGEWQQTEKRIQVMDPATFTVLAEIGDAGVSDGLDAVAAASDAFQTWSVTPARQRAEVLRRAFEIMTAELETCARIISLENGKAWRDALGRGHLRGGVLPLVLRGGVPHRGRLPLRPESRQDDHHRPPPDRRRLHDHAVELPGRDGDPQAGAGAGGRLHGRAQARQARPR